MPDFFKKKLFRFISYLLKNQNRRKNPNPAINPFRSAHPHAKSTQPPPAGPAATANRASKGLQRRSEAGFTPHPLWFLGQGEAFGVITLVTVRAGGP
jgi:hypothetical protein